MFAKKIPLLMAFLVAGTVSTQAGAVTLTTEKFDISATNFHEYQQYTNFAVAPPIATLNVSFTITDVVDQYWPGLFFYGGETSHLISSNALPGGPLDYIDFSGELGAGTASPIPKPTSGFSVEISDFGYRFISAEYYTPDGAYTTSLGSLVASTVSPVPLPGSVGMFSVAMAGLVGLGMSKFRRATAV